MAGYFDVGKMPPGTPDCIATRCINLMCALLKDIDYQTLYTTPIYDDSGNSTLDVLINHVNNLPPELQRGATTDDHIVIPLLAGKEGAFIKCREELSQPGTPPITLGQLFYRIIPAKPIDPTDVALRKILDILQALPIAPDEQLYIFCLPFVAIQAGLLPPGDSGPTQEQFDAFIKILGAKTMQDFFDAPYTHEEKVAAVEARRLYILREPAPPSNLRGDGGSQKGNNKRCGGNTCISSTDPEHWCSEITNPDGSTGCSLNSD